jgi:hypothetical protein
MDLNSRDARRNYDFPPLLMCCFAVGVKREFGFDQSCALNSRSTLSEMRRSGPVWN